MEKFYCVGSKQHYDLEVLEVAEKPSKGGSIRYSLVSRSPPGHKVTKICKKEVYDHYAKKLAGKEAEDTTPVEAPASEPEGSEPTPAGPSSTPDVDDAGLAVPQAFCAEHNSTFEACGCEKKSAEDFEADWFAVKCVECEKPGYSDEMNMYNGMYLCARCISRTIK